MKSITDQNSSLDRPRKPGFHIMTWGCQMNIRDTQWLAGRLTRLGLRESPLEEAQAIILNTCSVREKPEQKVKSALRRIRQARGNDADILIAVTGCVAQQAGRTLFGLEPMVRLIAGADGIQFMPEAIVELLSKPGEKRTYLDFDAEYGNMEYAGGKGPIALVDIMRGCDNFCAYCIVPFTRGRQKSRAAQIIITECEASIKGGAREIMLLGQNVNAYGLDKNNNEPCFPDLLRRVARLEGLERLRFITAHPKDMDPSTIEAFAALPVLCPRLHLPLQAGSDKILKAMGRKYDQKHFLELVEALRACRLDIALSTDLIVGFPGESEEDFQDTLGMMEQCGFMSSFSFCYSDRPFARAAMFPDKIEPEVKLERLARLQSLQDKLATRWLQGRVGQRTDVLIEGPSARGNLSFWQGKDPYGATVNVELPENVDHTGEITSVIITEAKRHTLAGVVRKENNTA